MRSKLMFFSLPLALICVLSAAGNVFAVPGRSGAAVAAAPATPALREVSLGGWDAPGGFSVRGRVVLDRKAPSDIAVTLTWDQKSPGFPRTVVVPAGQDGVSFIISTPAAERARSARLSASYNGVTRSASINLMAVIEHRAPRFSRLSIAADEVAGKEKILGTVVLGGAARAPVIVTLASDNENARVPAAVTVAAGENSQTFEIAVSRVKEDQKAVISASYNNNTRSAALILKARADADAAALKELSLDADEVLGGSGVKGRLLLSAPAPADIFVALASDNEAAGLPTGVTVPQGRDGASFNIAVAVVERRQKAKLSASFNGVVKTVSLIVRRAPPAPRLIELSVDGDEVQGGRSARAQVGLSDKAPEDLAVILAAGHPTVKTPKSVVVPKGRDNASFMLPTAAVTQDQKVLLSASFNGVTRSVSWVVKAPPATAPAAPARAPASSLAPAVKERGAVRAAAEPSPMIRIDGPSLDVPGHRVGVGPPDKPPPPPPDPGRNARHQPTPPAPGAALPPGSPAYDGRWTLRLRSQPCESDLAVSVSGGGFSFRGTHCGVEISGAGVIDASAAFSGWLSASGQGPSVPFTARASPAAQEL